MERVGQRNEQGAIFVYKDDNTKSAAWQAVEVTNKSHGGICGELHTKKGEFLGALSEWNEATEPDNAYLCIYAHMGKPGICCVSNDATRAITWQELAEAMHKPVELIWLVGCKSQECLSVWSPLVGPVRHVLLATDKSDRWRPLVQHFAAEISLKNIRPYDKMRSYLLSVEPELARHTGYFRPNQQRDAFEIFPQA